MQVFVEQSWGLFETVQGLTTLEAFVRLDGNAVRAVKIDPLMRRQGAIEKRCFDVVLSDDISPRRSDCKRETNGWSRRNRYVCFLIVPTKLLGVAAGRKTSFVALNDSVTILFELENPFRLNALGIRRHVGEIFKITNSSQDGVSRKVWSCHEETKKGTTTIIGVES